MTSRRPLSRRIRRILRRRRRVHFFNLLDAIKSIRSTNAQRQQVAPQNTNDLVPPSSRLTSPLPSPSPLSLNFSRPSLAEGWSWRVSGRERERVCERGRRRRRQEGGREASRRPCCLRSRLASSLLWFTRTMNFATLAHLEPRCRCLNLSPDVSKNAVCTCSVRRRRLDPVAS